MWNEQNINFLEFDQAQDPQIWSFSTVDLQVIFPASACIVLYMFINKLLEL